jgi:hypothetical protein
MEKLCPLDNFELVMYSGGGIDARTYPLCPNCYNNPPFEDIGRGQLVLFFVANHNCGRSIVVLRPMVAPKACHLQYVAKCTNNVVFMGFSKALMLFALVCSSMSPSASHLHRTQL